MKRFCAIAISAATSWLGWWLGSQIGLFTALTLSMIGAGVGLYYGRRLTQF